jgi:hypothetical protein
VVKPDGVLWVCYPKGGKNSPDLNRDVLGKPMENKGWLV